VAVGWGGGVGVCLCLVGWVWGVWFLFWGVVVVVVLVGILEMKKKGPRRAWVGQASHLIAKMRLQHRRIRRGFHAWLQFLNKWPDASVDAIFC
jgi:hypothetical protein